MATNDRDVEDSVGYLAATIFAAICGFVLGAAFPNGCPVDPMNAPFGCAEFLLSRYQTMIAAVIAAIAVFPVWRQVRLQKTQTDFLKSEALRHRISTLGGLRETLAKQAGSLREQLQWYPDYINCLTFWAHDAAQLVDTFIDFIHDQKALCLDGDHVAAARADLITKLDTLSRALWVINWDVHLSDEDAPNEEQEAKLRSDASEAEKNLEVTIAAALSAVSAVQSAILEDLGKARARLHALSENIV
jgi:hypothetical protein